MKIEILYSYYHLKCHLDIQASKIGELQSDQENTLLKAI
jgi:hypothetical protein